MQDVMAWGLMICGVGAAVYFFGLYDTSIPSGMSGSVENIGRIYRGLCGTMVSVGMVLTGVILLVGSWIEKASARH